MSWFSHLGIHLPPPVYYTCLSAFKGRILVAGQRLGWASLSARCCLLDYATHVLHDKACTCQTPYSSTSYMGSPVLRCPFQQRQSLRVEDAYKSRRGCSLQTSGGAFIQSCFGQLWCAFAMPEVIFVCRVNKNRSVRGSSAGGVCTGMKLTPSLLKLSFEMSAWQSCLLCVSTISKGAPDYLALQYHPCCIVSMQVNRTLHASMFFV